MTRDRLFSLLAAPYKTVRDLVWPPWAGIWMDSDYEDGANWRCFYCSAPCAVFNPHVEVYPHSRTCPIRRGRAWLKQTRRKLGIKEDKP